VRYVALPYVFLSYHINKKISTDRVYLFPQLSILPIEYQNRKELFIMAKNKDKQKKEKPNNAGSTSMDNKNPGTSNKNG